MSFYKTLCITSPNKYKTPNDLVLNETQRKYLSILDDIYPVIFEILDGTYSQTLNTEKLLLLEKPYNDLLIIYSSLFSSYELNFVSDYHPQISFTIIDIEPNEASDWFDYYRDEVIMFGQIISRLIKDKKVSTPANINQLVKRVRELLDIRGKRPWTLMNTVMGENIGDYKKHWLKGFTFYYRKDDGSVISLHFEKTIKGKSNVGYEFFRAFYSAFQKDIHTYIPGNSILTEVKKKIQTFSEFNDLKANFNKKIKDTDFDGIISIEYKNGGYRLKIEE